MNNLPRQQLCTLVARYGKTICDDPYRCKGLLHDFCGQFKGEISVLMSALEEGVTQALSVPQNPIATRMQLERQIHRLQEERGLAEDAARWAVESWAIALGIDIGTEETLKTAPAHTALDAAAAASTVASTVASAQPPRSAGANSAALNPASTARPWLWVGVASLAVLGIASSFVTKPDLPEPTSVAASEPSLPSPVPLPQFRLPELVCQEPQPATLPQKPDFAYPNGSKFYGELKGNGTPADGRATILFPNGNRYDGEFQNGQRNGCGTFKYSGFGVYMGEFENDKLSGIGELKLQNGNRYRGEFSQSKCQGEGVFLYADGRAVTGSWNAGNYSGSADGSPSCNSL